MGIPFTMGYLVSLNSVSFKITLVLPTPFSFFPSKNLIFAHLSSQLLLCYSFFCEFYKQLMAAIWDLNPICDYTVFGWINFRYSYFSCS